MKSPIVRGKLASSDMVNGSMPRSSSSRATRMAKAKRIETGLVKRQVIIERRQVDLLLDGDLLYRRNNP